MVADLNARPDCDGILVQSPLPAPLGPAAEQVVFDAIDPAKDVDGFHPENVGRLVQKRPTLVACTPLGVMELLDRSGIALDGARAVVIGRSDIVGKPMALLLLHRNATVTICHSRTQGPSGRVRVGRHPGRGHRTAGVRDAGLREARRHGRRRRHQPRRATRRSSRRIFPAGSRRRADFERRGSIVVGDVHPGVAEVAGALTPVPGGVGPLTIAMLLANTLKAAEARCSRSR